MSDVYAPNQQMVRGDGSGPAEEGTGGSPPVDGTGGDGGSPPPEGEGGVTPAELDAMTKDELIAYAARVGAVVSATDLKADIRTAIDEAEGR